VRIGSIRTVANYLHFLRVLDEHTRDSPLGAVLSGYEMHVIAQQCGLVSQGDLSAARWTGELVDLGYLTHGPAALGAPRCEIPRGAPWTDEELRIFGDYRVTATGRQEADRMRRLDRETATDAALGAAPCHQ
jgi:hypothetical protein